MLTTIPIFQHSQERPTYFYDYKIKQFFVAHPLLSKCYISDKTNDLNNSDLNDFALEVISADTKESNYYKNKYLFLKQHGFFSKQENKESNQYNDLFPSIIKSLLENLNHIVFEVTDACNLRCKYCGYGELYYDHDERRNTMLPFSSVKTLMEYLYPYLSKSDSSLFISFYGGEPLLNMPLIKQTVEFVEQLFPNRAVQFSMTTNGVLLKQNIKYLSEKHFRLLVSFDGDEKGQSYRVFHNGRNSFHRVFSNVKLIQREYPEYFDQYVSFNAVIHNKNSIAATDAFIMENFGKTPRFSPLDDAGIRPDKMDVFKQMYNDISEELNKNQTSKETLSNRFINDPFVFRTALFIKEKLAYTQYDSYESFFAPQSAKIPGGTCLPFQKKLFLTVNNKILPCERIDQNNVLGRIVDNSVDMDFGEIAAMYNDYYKKLSKQCRHCYRSESCAQCFFQIDNFQKHKICHAFLNKERFSREMASSIDFIEKNPELPKRILNEVILK